MDRRQFKKAVKHWFGRISLKVVYFLVRFLPVEFIYPLGNWLGSIGYGLARKHRKVALEGLDIAFGKELTKNQIERLAKESFRNMVKGSLEVMAYLWNRDMKNKIAIEGKRNLEEVLSKGKGAIGLTAHFGNFPLLGVRLAQEGYRVNYILRRMRDDKLEDYFQSKRNQLDIGWIISQPRKECVETCLERLRRNQLLLLQMDQNFGKKGVFVDFFGREAATPTGPVVFSLRTGAGILPIFIVRQKDETHKIFIDSSIPLEIKGNHKQTILFNTAKLTKIIESYIRRYPSQWGWIHRRWKDR